jgi:hypothetical protein
MPKIRRHRHVSTRMDRACTDGRVYLQKKETVKGCTGGGLVKEPPMLKSDVRPPDQDVSFESIEVRKRVCTLFKGFFALYRRFQAFSRSSALNEFLYLDL